jgi:uncharacterized protein
LDLPALQPAISEWPKLSQTEKIIFPAGIRVFPIEDCFAVLPPAIPGVAVLSHEAHRLLQTVQNGQSLSAFKESWPEGVYEQTLALLLSCGILATTGHNLESRAQPHETSSVLTAWLHLTNHCSLACPYCYVTQNDIEMSPQIARQAVQTIFHSAGLHGYRRVKLKYAGGEPSLNFQILRVAHEEAEQLSLATGIGFESTFLTNAIHLSASQIEYLSRHNISVMVSLDGLGDFQDTQRPLSKSSESSFIRVEKTLQCLTAAGITPLISITITRQNLPGLPTLVEYLLERSLPFTLNFFRPPTSLTQNLAPDSASLINGLLKTYQVIENHLPTQSLLACLGDRANLAAPHSYTCGVGRNYLAIDCQGGIAKCQMELDHPITSIWDPDPLSLLQNDLSALQNLPAKEKECQDCSWSQYCTGGCPRLAYQQTGQHNSRSPLCEVYQAILPEIVRLEALRLIRFGQPFKNL